MIISTITLHYRKQAQLTLEAFGRALAELLPGYSFTKQAVKNWERGVQNPDRYFLLLCALRYGDWRRDWALDCLAVLQPELFAPATKSEATAETAD
jgi:transcriptional regulator with XRE-family HTH domain